MRNIYRILVLACFALVGGSSQAQTPDIGIGKTIALGEVTALDATTNKLMLKTKDGDIEVQLSANTVYKRVSPEKPNDIASAVASSLAEIGVGDRVIAVGTVAADKKSVPARQLILMTKGDLTKRQQAEGDAWRNGVSGKVTSVNLATKEITVSSRSLAGEKPVIINDVSKVKIRRYAPTSVKYSDTKESSLAEIQIGDQVRARGTKSEDGSRFTAEEIVSGNFKTVGGTITAVDAAKGEVTIKDIQTNKPVTIIVNSNTLLRKFPAEMAQMMARMQAMRAAGITGNPNGGQFPNGGQRPNNAPNGEPNPNGGQPSPNPNGGQGGMGMMRGGGRGDLDDLLERLPVVTVADLKVGDAIATSTTANQEPNRFTAIKLVAGVEPFFTAPTLPQGQGGRQGASPSFSVPGLDSLGLP